MFRYIPPIALIFWATCSTAAIQQSDFWFHEDGDTVFIDGNRGAPLHIDYIGAALTKPLKVRVTPSNPYLKVSPSICTFTPKNNDCRLSVHNAKGGEKVYGVNQFTITEVGTSYRVLKAQAASDTATVGFGVGVQQKSMPKPISAVVRANYGLILTGGMQKVIVTNATTNSRDYQARFVYSDKSNGLSTADINGNSKVFSVPGKGSCYLDENVSLPQATTYTYTLFTLKDSLSTISSRISDVTNLSDPIYNDAYVTGSYITNNSGNLMTCSANGLNGCSSNKWAAWNIGLANIGSQDMSGGVKAGQIEVLRDNSWNNGSFIYFETGWDSNSLALLLMQGSPDGAGFNAAAAAPTIEQVKSAPPCSSYVKSDTPDPSVTYSVQVKSFGPGTITMPAGGQCKQISTPGLDFTYCTGSGYKNAWYEITAVPDAGKTFKGWYSSGLCDDKNTTCKFQLTSDVSMSPNFQ